MRKVIFGILLSLFIVGNCYGFETGKWVGSEPKDGYEGRLHIEKSGKNIKVTDISFFIQETPTFSSGCGVYEGKTVVKGNVLEVYDEGKLSFTIKQNGKNIQVIPHLSVDVPMCMGGIVPDWVHSQKGIKDMEKQISEMKWKKVKKFPWE